LATLAEAFVEGKIPLLYQCLIFVHAYLLHLHIFLHMHFFVM
jgi:hypothetical protein